MDVQDVRGLGEFVREHHVHYEVEPEAVADGEQPVTGFEVRLFATHGESHLEAPGCRRCLDLERDLRSFAEQVVAPASAAGRAEIEPSVPSLYASTEVPGADEVAVSVRIRCDAHGHRAAGGEERCLGEVRRRLDALGVPRR